MTRLPGRICAVLRTHPAGLSTLAVQAALVAQGHGQHRYQAVSSTLYALRAAGQVERYAVPLTPTAHAWRLREEAQP